MTCIQTKKQQESLRKVGIYGNQNEKEKPDHQRISVRNGLKQTSKETTEISDGYKYRW